jgi:transcriptional regulator with XRE-family HTH domain
MRIKNIVLGKRLGELRERRGLTRETAAENAGIPVEALKEIEEGPTMPIPERTLLAIADQLKLQTKQELHYLLRLNRNPRRFKIYNVGIERTGTKSIAAIFSTYHSYHEFMWSETIRSILDYKKGAITEAAFSSFVRDRDTKGMLELDSAGYSFFYLQRLVDEFHSAQFIFCIRDCYSWLDSLVNTYLHGINAEPLIQEYTSFLFGVDQTLFADRAAFVGAFPDHIDGFLSYWNDANNAVLEVLPPVRSLIVRTHEISSSLEAMARLAGVDERTLIPTASHQNRSPEKYSILQESDPAFLERKFTRHCAWIMDRFFPGYTLTGFLNGTNSLKTAERG